MRVKWMIPIFLIAVSLVLCSCASSPSAAPQPRQIAPTPEMKIQPYHLTPTQARTQPANTPLRIPNNIETTPDAEVSPAHIPPDVAPSNPTQPDDEIQTPDITNPTIPDEEVPPAPVPEPIPDDVPSTPSQPADDIQTPGITDPAIPGEEIQPAPIPIPAPRTIPLNPTQRPRPAAQTSDIVYIADTGETYHRAGCRYVAYHVIPITRAEAESRGFTPCPMCKP